MKRIKRIASLLLAMAMVLAMSVTVFAAEDKVNITVDVSDPEGSQENKRTYNYYKIFDASLVDQNDAGKGVSYYIPADTLGDGRKTALEGLKIYENDKDTEGKKVFTFVQSVDKTRWIVNIDETIDFGETSSNSVKLAEALKAVVDSNPTLFAKSADFNAGVAQSVTQGYYLITSSLGTKMILNTYVTREITEKNEYPSNTKTENKATAEIGEVVTYTVEVNIPAAVAEKEIVVVDKITDGLTMNTSITVAGDKNNTLNGLTFVEDKTAGVGEGWTQYKATIPAETVKANAGGKLTLTYTATVNHNAVVAVPEKNDAHIVYDNYVSKDIEVEVKTYGFSVKKIDGAKVTDGMANDAKFALEALNGAEFTLWNAETNGEEIKVVAVGENGTVIAKDDTTSTIVKYRVAENDTEKGQAVNIKVGEATIDGLREATYYLQEVKAPDGYNMLTDRKPISVSATTAVEGIDIAIENNAGSLLPSTGGIGTTIFYTVGGILVLGAGILLVAKKRMSAR